jgi:2-dehydropantoate 2-reductase
MRILVLGAGALGGYFGARLVEAGRDVTFLVRPKRAAKLQRGLFVKSPAGDIRLDKPQAITADKLKQPFDVVLLTCKAYDLENAMEAIAPAVGSNTSILPLLNGMSHIDRLNARFGKANVLGGWCGISATVNQADEILHLAPFHTLSFGEQDGGKSARVAAVHAATSGAKFEVLASDAVIHEMWEKWIFIAAGAGITCLMRGTAGDIVAAGAVELSSALLGECAAIAAAHGFPPRQGALERYTSMLTAPGSAFTASMLRDIEANMPIEADHILGDLLQRGADKAQSTPLLRAAFAHVKTYEARRSREQRGAKAA